MDKATPIDHENPHKQAQFPDAVGQDRTHVFRLLVSRFQVRVLGGSLTFSLQMARKCQRIRPSSGAVGSNAAAIGAYPRTSSIALPIPGTRYDEPRGMDDPGPGGPPSQLKPCRRSPPRKACRGITSPSGSPVTAARSLTNGYWVDDAPDFPMFTFDTNPLIPSDALF